ncbi:MAG: outer membrane beta-barrel protein [Hyphomicrobium sp.]
MIALASPAVAQSPIAPIWSGMYAGIHGGGNWAEFKASQGGGSLGSSKEQAYNFGGHLGFNVGLGLVVVGLEADLGIDTFSATSSGIVLGIPVSAKAESTASGTARARVGLPIGPALLYATAGYAWVNISGKVDATGFASGRGSSSIDGIVYGIGAEMKVLPRVSVRVEALHFDYSKQRFDGTMLGGETLEIDADTTVVRAGVSFAFN